MKKLKARSSGASFGIATVNGVDVGVAQIKDETFFSIVGISELQAKQTGKEYVRAYGSLHQTAVKTGAVRRFHDGPIVNGGSRPTVCYVSQKFVYENARIGNNLPLLIQVSGAKPMDFEVAMVPHELVISAAEFEAPKPVVDRHENGEDTIVFKGKNILQRLFGGLIRP